MLLLQDDCCNLHNNLFWAFLNDASANKIRNSLTYWLEFAIILQKEIERKKLSKI